MNKTYHDKRRSEPDKGESTQNKSNRAVSASDLSQMGVCERKMMFEHRFGKRFTEHQLKAMRRGQKAHAQFFREAAVRSEVALKTNRCCIDSTCIFGQALRTKFPKTMLEKLSSLNTIGRRLTAFLCIRTNLRHTWLVHFAWSRFLMWAKRGQVLLFVRDKARATGGDDAN